MPFTENETDEQLLERLGTDPARWAEEYIKMPHDREHPDRLRPQLQAWFCQAIDAGRREGITMVEVLPEPGKTPFRAQCSDETCKHRFLVAWLPMEIEKAARLMQLAACPMCGSESVSIAGDA